MAKSRSKVRLGRGLDAIFNDLPADEGRAGIIEILVDEIYPSPTQPRKNIDGKKIKELADSIKQNGLLSPILVRKVNTKYEIVAGERRYHASIMAGLDAIPSIVKVISDEEAFKLSLIENLQREDLNPMEEAEAYHMLTTQFALAHQDIAISVCKDRSTITNALRLLGLPEEAKQALRDGVITTGHARTILMLDKISEKIALLNMIISKGLTVREAEGAVSKIRRLNPKKRIKADPYLDEIATLLSEGLSTHVVCLWGKAKGKIVINVASKAEMGRITEKLLKTAIPI